MDERIEGPITCLMFSRILINYNLWGTQAPTGKAGQAKDSNCGMALKEKGYKARFTVHCGSVAACSYSSVACRVFIRRLLDLSATVKKLSHHVHLNLGILAWWNELLVEWNRVSLLSALGDQQPSITLTSDFTGSWVCGAYWSFYWFQLAWSATACPVDTNIATKELIPIVIAAALWGQHWSGQVVCSQCDSIAVVSVLNHCTSRDRELMHLLRCLTFFEARSSCRLVAAHI